MKNEATRLFHKQGNKYDEYYTTLEEVEYIFNSVINEDFTDKIIYCPFDGDESAFVKYIIGEYKKLGYKEFWYTSDDFKNHEDLIEKCDVIISNPPFSLLSKEILPMFKRYNKKFFLFGSLICVNKYIQTYLSNELKYIRRNQFKFITPHINENGKNFTNVSGTIYLTNFDIKETYKEYKLNNKFLSKTFNDIPHVYYQDGTLTIDKMNDFPNDYYEPVRCPLSCLEYKYQKYLEFINVPERKYQVLGYSDNKIRFLRILAKRKP